VTGSAVNTASSSARTPRPLQGPFTRWPRIADGVLALVVFAAEVTNAALQDSADVEDLGGSVGDLPVLAYVVLAGTAALYWRRRHPMVVLGVSLAMLPLSAGLGNEGGPLLATAISLYAVGRYVEEDRYSLGGVVVSLAFVAIGGLTGDGPFVDIGIGLSIMFLPWYFGRRIRIRGDYLAILHERAEYLERERQAEARRAVAEERSRIARELHDVVAHRVSMMTVQAGAAKTVAADDLHAALGAMEAVEQAGRQALGELRHLLGVLRPGSEAEDLGPQVGVAQVPRLVDQLRETGMDISLTTDALVDLPAHVDVSAYRIVQEALTNVLKHAGPGARSEVRLATDDHVLTIEVANSGSGGTILPGSGHGIVGMRERALLLGGTLEAGSRDGGGFRVVARLPIGEEPA